MSDNIDLNVQTTPAEGETSAAPAPAIPPGTPAAPATAATPNVAPQPSATGGDRADWVPPHRLRETREAAIRQANEEFARREEATRAELARYQEQIRRLVGVEAPENPQIAEVRNQFGQLFPDLAKLEGKAAMIEQLLERANDLENQTKHYWTSHGQRTMENLFKKAEATYGNTLSDDAKRHLHQSFVGFVQSSEEMQARYESDPTVVDEFWRAFSSNFIDPARREAAAQTLSRVPGALPQDSPSGVPRVSPAEKPTTLDERAKMAFDVYNATRRT